MNNITNSPDYDEMLFHVDIVKMYDETIKILETSKMDPIQEAAITYYVNALVDAYNKHNGPVSELTELGQVADLLDQMWEMTCSLVEDIPFRRAFILICRCIFLVNDLPEGKYTTSEIIAWCQEEK